MTTPFTDPALALLEFDSIATGIAAGDAMIKRAPVTQIRAGTIQPGHYLVLVTGDVASVEEAVKAGQETGRSCLQDTLFLPNVHEGVVAALFNGRQPVNKEALGIVETRTVAAAIRAADAGLKGAEVQLVQLRLGDGLGGKGLALFTGLVADVEAAVEISTAVAHDQLFHHAIISQLDGEMKENVGGNGRFGRHFNWENY
ncbi:MAG: BMC domain-containing protein [Anaerolineae bacterium]